MHSLRPRDNPPSPRLPLLLLKLPSSTLISLLLNLIHPTNLTHFPPLALSHMYIQGG